MLKKALYLIKTDVMLLM